MQKYETDSIIVRFDPQIFTRSGCCVRGLRAVFDVKRRPWVNLDGALSFELRNEGRQAT